MSERTRSSNNTALMKGALAVVIIVACLAYIGWRFWPAPPIVVKSEDDAYAKWAASWASINGEHAAKQDATYWALGRVNVNPTEDRSGVVVIGRVSTPAELAAVKAAVEKVQPALPVTWQVSIGG